MLGRLLFLRLAPPMLPRILPPWWQKGRHRLLKVTPCRPLLSDLSPSPLRLGWFRFGKLRQTFRSSLIRLWLYQLPLLPPLPMEASGLAGLC